MAARCAIIFGIIVTVVASCAADEPAAGLEKPVLLLLRNGQSLTGHVSRVGDRYVVAATNSEIRVPARDVELVCRDLEEAYRWKRDRIAPRQINAHLELAEWCLKQRQFSHAADELSEVIQQEPDNPRAALIERRLKSLIATTQPVVPASATTAASAISIEQLDRLTREMPAGSVEQFTATIQPLILNRCAASGCHGVESKSEFRLLRPLVGKSTPRRFTQRNLHAAMTVIDRDSPLDSPLLKIPRTPHAGGKTPIFGDREEATYQQLVAWVKKATNSAEPSTPAPATIHDPNDTLNQKTPLLPNSRNLPLKEDSLDPSTGDTAPADHDPVETSAAAATTAAKTPLSPAVPAPSAKPTTPATRPPPKSKPTVRRGAGEPFVPKDPFDPEIFNRRFLANPEK